jgi:uncharacterized membrane protein
MSSTNVTGDAIAVFTEHRNRILAIVAALVVGTLLLGLLGFGNVLGGLFVLVYGVVWLVVVAFVLWLLYRLVVAIERIAGAQERIASAQFQAEIEESTKPASAETEERDEEGSTDEDSATGP